MLNRDSQYLAQLRDYYAQNGALPSFTNVGRMLGMKSTGSVAALVRRMREDQYLESGVGGRIQPGQRFFERQRSESPVPAGLPQTSQDVTADTIAIDRYLVDEPSRTVLVQVKGDSMVKAGLFSGDTVVVKRGAPTKPGDIVVAQVDGEYTIKYLAKDRKGFYLKPGNENYADIRPRDDLDIFGKVTGCFRKY